MLYENSEDRKNQSTAAWVYQDHLLKLGSRVRVTETRQEYRECYDFGVYDAHGMWTGVLEIKCLTYPEEAMMGWPGLMIEKPQMSRLRKQFWAAGRWTKEVVLLMMSADLACYAINARDIAAMWSSCKVAPDGWVKSDHGTKPRDAEARLFPIPLWVKL